MLARNDNLIVRYDRKISRRTGEEQQSKQETTSVDLALDCARLKPSWLVTAIRSQTWHNVTSVPFFLPAPFVTAMNPTLFGNGPTATDLEHRQHLHEQHKNASQSDASDDKRKQCPWLHAWHDPLAALQVKLVQKLADWPFGLRCYFTELRSGHCFVCERPH